MDWSDAVWLGTSPLTRGKHDHYLALWAMAGTSPLTRGKLSMVAIFLLPPGNIPAHAGKT